MLLTSSASPRARRRERSRDHFSEGGLWPLCAETHDPPSLPPHPCHISLVTWALPEPSPVQRDLGFVSQTRHRLAGNQAVISRSGRLQFSVHCSLQSPGMFAQGPRPVSTCKDPHTLWICWGEHDGVKSSASLNLPPEYLDTKGRGEEWPKSPQ